MKHVPEPPSDLDFKQSTLGRREFSMQASIGFALGFVVTSAGILLPFRVKVPMAVGLGVIGLLIVVMFVIAWRLRRNPMKRGWSVGIFLGAGCGGLLIGTCYALLENMERAV